MSEFVLPISGEIGIGGVIFNDTQITIEDIPGGHRLTARRGSDVQTMDVLNGVDAPVPDIQVADSDHGHDVTITVGKTVKTFHIHDGVDAPVPEITIEAVSGGHKVTAAVGEVVKSFTVLDGKDGKDGQDGANGKDAPVPRVTVSKISTGHRITITVGTAVQSFDVEDGADGKDAITPVVSVTEIDGGHRVTITTGSKVESFDVMDGKDGEGGGASVEVDATLSVEGMAADAKATGAAVAPLAAISETTTSNAITWDGVVGDRVYVDASMTADSSVLLVKVSDYAPESYMLTQEGYTLIQEDGGTTSEVVISAEEAAQSIVSYDGGYSLGDAAVFVISTDNQLISDETLGKDVVFPQKGTYFIAMNIPELEINAKMLRLTSPLLAVPTTTVRESAIPDSIARVKDISKHLVQTNYTENDPTSPAYMKNRPFHDEWSLALFSGMVDFDADDPAVLLPRMVTEGKEYTIAVGDSKLTGVAHAALFMGQVPVVAIGDIEGSGIYAIVIESDGMFGCMFGGSDASGQKWCALVEGNSLNNKRSVPEDVIAEIIPGYAYQVSDVAFTADELSNGFTIEAVYNGENITLSESDVVITNNAPHEWHIDYGMDAEGFGGKSVASMTPSGFVFHDDDADTGSGFTAKSITIKNSTAFAPRLELKKLDKKFLPGAVVFHYNMAETGILYLYRSTEVNDAANRVTIEEFKTAFQSGMPIYIDAVLSGSSMGMYSTVVSMMMTNDFGAAAFVSLDRDTNTLGMMYLYTAEYTAT